MQVLEQDVQKIRDKLGDCDILGAGHDEKQGAGERLHITEIKNKIKFVQGLRKYSSCSGSRFLALVGYHEKN